MPEKLSFLERERCFGQVFWSLFLAVGLAGLYGLFFIGVPKLLRNPPKNPWEGAALLLPLVVGGVFAWLGAWGVAGRRGIDLDRSDSSLTRWWGFFVPLRRERFDLGAFERVSLGSPVQQGGTKTKYWVYPVTITGPGGTSVELEAASAEEAGRFSREINDFLGLKGTPGG